ncbi:MAG: thiamine diphosphokinase [Acidimicrobiia bacterium]|nr:thiamine diphosphokinase [Acidimicrobiia bacterium]
MNEPSKRHIVVISGATALADRVVAAIPETGFVVAADGGLDRALAAGIEPDVLIGDLDSVSDDALAWAREHALVVAHSADKDLTDTELALSFAADRVPDRITLVGGGDRLDHSIAAIGALGAPMLAGVARLDGWWDGQHLEVLHAPRRRVQRVQVESILSLLALHGRCAGVSITGARWTLDRADLEAGVGHGISNLALVDAIGVAVEAGVLTLFDDPLPEEGIHQG